MPRRRTLKPAILVVEPLKFFADLAAEALTDAGCTVEVARSKVEALERIRGSRPKLLVLDATVLTLAEMTSLRKAAKAPSVVLGGFSPVFGSTPGDVLAATGAAVYVMKPFRGSELAEAVLAVLSGSDAAIERLRSPSPPAAEAPNLARLSLEELARQPFRDFADELSERIVRKAQEGSEAVGGFERGFLAIESVLHYGVPLWFELEFSDDAGETVAALRQADLLAEAAALESAMARLGTPWPEESDTRRARIERMGPNAKGAWSAEAEALRFTATNEAKLVAYVLRNARAGRAASGRTSIAAESPRRRRSRPRRT